MAKRLASRINVVCDAPAHFPMQPASGKPAACNFLAVHRLAAATRARETSLALAVFALVQAAGALHPVAAAELRLARRPADPYGSPRPGPDETHVPLATSLFFDLRIAGDGHDVIARASLNVSLRRDDGVEIALVRNGQLASGVRGWLRSGQTDGQPQLLAYLEPQALHPLTRYTVQIMCRSHKGLELLEADRSWQFTTEAASSECRMEFAFDLHQPQVTWQRGLFTGYGTTGFCISKALRLATYAQMAEVRRWSPHAWSMQRHFWLTGREHQATFLMGSLPNLVRERETRRVRRMQVEGDRVGLLLEDFFGHEQYGIQSHRPLAPDYHVGDEVLIYDPQRTARTRVVEVDDAARTLWVAAFQPPPTAWDLAYTQPPATEAHPHTPGLFASGGCHVCKFSPPGTAAYYWERLDQEYDLACGRFGQRLVVNFADAPGDLALDGRNWTTAKDYAQLHEVVGQIAGHIIDRYGESSLDFVWSVFNEPDLGRLFWRADWEELQRFYDYTTDAVLRAFEDRGYDSQRVFIGGLELGGIFGTNLRLREFLAHCSPAGEAAGAIEHNAAYADTRLAGRRSQRVEALCRATNGRGAPCDFVSIHAYNRSKLMADKLIRAKQMALEVDPEYFATLWVNSHESCPGWDLPPDPAYADSYLGNGYFPTWCADVARRRLARAAEDPRYANGEMLLTFWAWPNPGLGGGCDCVREFRVDDDGDGRPDRTETLPMPILHFLGLLGQFGPQYLVLPEHQQGGHVVSGFASQGDGVVRLLLYSHHMFDTQSRSSATFTAVVRLAGLLPGARRARMYRFDRQNNSYYELACALRAEQDAAAEPSPQDEQQIEAALTNLASGDADGRAAALMQLHRLGPRARGALPRLLGLAATQQDPAFLAELLELMRSISGSAPITKAQYNALAARARLQISEEWQQLVAPDGTLCLETVLPGNAACLLVLDTPTQ
jgi:hypothetical protein